MGILKVLTKDGNRKLMFHDGNIHHVAEASVADRRLDDAAATAVGNIGLYTKEERDGFTENPGDFIGSLKAAPAHPNAKEFSFKSLSWYRRMTEITAVGRDTSLVSAFNGIINGSYTVQPAAIKFFEQGNNPAEYVFAAGESKLVITLQLYALQSGDTIRMGWNSITDSGKFDEAKPFPGYVQIKFDAANTLKFTKTGGTGPNEIIPPGNPGYLSTPLTLEDNFRKYGIKSVSVDKQGQGFGASATAIFQFPAGVDNIRAEATFGVEAYQRPNRVTISLDAARTAANQVEIKLTHDRFDEELDKWLNPNFRQHVSGFHTIKEDE